MSKHISMIFPLIIIVHDSSITFLFELLRLVSVLRQHQLSIFRSDGLRNCQGLLAAAQQFLRPWGMESRHKDLSNMGIVENFKVGLNLNLCIYIYTEICRYYSIVYLEKWACTRWEGDVPLGFWLMAKWRIHVRCLQIVDHGRGAIRRFSLKHR